MASTMDMSLDDIIKNNRVRGPRGGGAGGRGRRGRAPGKSLNGGRMMPGAVRRGPLSVNTRSSWFPAGKPALRTRSMPLRHDLLEDSIRAAGITGVEVGTKLYVSNLDPGVSNDDIRELFSEIGELKRYAIHYNMNGRPTGSAEVVYTRRSDAFAARRKYNNVILDGKLMKIEILGSSANVPPISAQVNVTGVRGRKKRTVVMAPRSGRFDGFPPLKRGSGRGDLRPGRGRGGLRPGRGRSGAGRGGRGRSHGKKQPVKSADELNKDLETYHAEAMQS